MKKKIVRFFKNIRNKIAKYISTNRMFLLFVIFALIETILVRRFTIGKSLSYKPIICDLALLVIIGSIGYFLKPVKQYKYFRNWLWIITAICVVNSVYYIFYTSFASFSLIAELGLVASVGDSLVDRFRFIDFIYLIFPIMYIFIHSRLKSGAYYTYVGKVEKGKKMFTGTILVGIIILAFTLVNIKSSDISRLVKQWNREYLVSRFGIILYQGNDLVQSMIPKISSLFGRDAAVKEFKDFYSVETVHNNNKYTDVLKDMNIVFVHMESIQSFLIDLSVNDQEITPTLNWLTRNGLFFDHFYPQISIGTSSDTEFTLNTSLMPANSGTVFVSYNNRKFIAIPQLLSDMGYYTFSSHANQSSMWNRNVMHPRLGYQELIFKDQFDIGDDDSDPRWLGLGLNDVDWFLQLEPKLEQIEDEHERYMGTILQLSNHSPFAATPYNKEGYDYFGRLDLTNTYTNKKGNEVTDDYLDDTDLGNYLRSAHYGDMALGTFLEYIQNNPDYYNNTVFVFYGDHYAKLAKKEFQYYYNYDTKTGSVRREGDDGYVNYDNFANDLNKNTPLIIWTKNEDVMRKLKGVNHNVMGMYDVLPTIGNMMGFSSKYALGHDIYDTKENNVVIFPSGDFITNKVYYSATTGSYVTIPQADGSMPVIDEDYISNLKEYAEKRLSVSNDIIVFDLIKEDLEEGSKDNGEISGD